MVIRIGTRGSTLAVIQAEFVQSALQSKFPNISSRIVTIRTSGDKITDRPLYDIGGKGLFVKEIEEALINNTIDIAVHSTKDVPGHYADGLEIPCVLPRGSFSDVLVSEKFESLNALPIGAKIGTSAVRRKVQLLAVRPDLEIIPIRGNLDTRLSKVRSGECDGIILAAAGLYRINRADVIREVLPPGIMVGAVGQGAICVQCRRDDIEIASVLRMLSDRKSFAAILAERSFLRAVDGSCDTPLGATARYISEDIMTMKTMLADGRGNMEFLERVFREEDAERIGSAMGEELKEKLQFKGV